MKSKDIVKRFEMNDIELDAAVQAIVAPAEEEVKGLYENSVKQFEPQSILHGVVASISNTEVVVDVGYKSEGVILRDEFDPAVKIGDKVEVLLEQVEDESGTFVISKRKADRIRGWERVMEKHKEGDIVTGKVTRKIKGGLLIDIGVPVFLPASQVSIRRTGDIAEFIGKTIECKIIKIDEARMNIVVSRRKLIEEERDRLKSDLLSKLNVGDIVRGTVKNIADFGAFVDLGGIDGLLHITDMSWGRINHPSELVRIDDVIEIKVLKIDHEKERIALGLKQKSESPWKAIDLKYPVGKKVRGEVVNLTNYGAFIKLEEGIEGLLHISEMSWTKRVAHPSEIVNVGDGIEVVVLDINPEKMEISLGMKQLGANPWDEVEYKYPLGTTIDGTVRNLTNYGAFIELEQGIDGLLHVSDMSWTKKLSNPAEMLKKGDKVKAKVLAVDKEKKRVALGMKQLTADPWEKDVPEKFKTGKVIDGVVTKLTNFGVFVEIDKDLEGLLHVSELSKKSANPNDVVKVGDKVEVEIIKVDVDERKIGLALVDKGEETKS